MRRTKEQKGITLIALIITIVVLLILAVVAINSIQNDGIISHAGNTAETYNQAVENEQQQLQGYLDYLNGPKAYKVGDKVKLKDDSIEPGYFYVIEDSAATEGKVTLITESCINVGNLIQSKIADPVAFSTEVYWTSFGIISETLPIPDSHIAAKAAYDYGAKIGADSGRLPTEYSEYENVGFEYELEKDQTLVVWESYCYYFDLGNTDPLVRVYDSTGVVSAVDLSHTSSACVRPIVEISKTLIESVTAE